MRCEGKYLCLELKVNRQEVLCLVPLTDVEFRIVLGLHPQDPLPRAPSGIRSPLRQQ